MSKIKVVIHGLGNIGQAAIAALEKSPDMLCLGLVRSAASVGSKELERRGLSDFASLEDLIAACGRPEAALICGPSRLAPAEAEAYLAAGLNTVDSFDIHSQIPQVLERLDKAAKALNRVAITAAGWDPGTDSVLRALFEAMAPVGSTFTNFGRGRSMGHSVAARAIEGVADAVSLTIPLGGGRHSRLVYILPQEGADREALSAALAADDYFSHDPLEIRFVDSAERLALVADNSHGVLLERLGASGAASNQRLSFDMRIDNPALTAQVMVSCVRAAGRLAPGAYTLIDIPPVALLPGERAANIARLV